MAMITFTPTRAPMTGQMWRTWSLRSSKTHPSAIRPLCSQSRLKSTAVSNSVGAWMKSASSGREKVGWYGMSVMRMLRLDKSQLGS